MRTGRANRQRGEIEATIDGERRILCMTLGALAELETAFGVDNIADLAGRFAGGKVGTRDVAAIIAAGLRGGGNVVDDRDLADCRIEGGIGGAIRLLPNCSTAPSRRRRRRKTLRCRSGPIDRCPPAAFPLGCGPAFRSRAAAADPGHILVADDAGIDGARWRIEADRCARSRGAGGHDAALAGCRGGSAAA